jgi:hypothetical protein
MQHPRPLITRSPLPPIVCPLPPKVRPLPPKLRPLPPKLRPLPPNLRPLSPTKGEQQIRALLFVCTPAAMTRSKVRPGPRLVSCTQRRTRPVCRTQRRTTSHSRLLLQRLVTASKHETQPCFYSLLLVIVISVSLMGSSLLQSKRTLIPPNVRLPHGRLPLCHQRAATATRSRLSLPLRCIFLLCPFVFF